MSVLVFVPNPESAKSLAAWTGVVCDPSEGIQYYCLEDEGSHATQTALRESLELADTDTHTITSFSALSPVNEVVEHCRKTKPQLLVSGFFSLGTINGRPQNSEALVRAVPCRAISPIFGTTPPKDVHSILMVVSRGSHDPTALRITEKLRRQLKANVTLATIEDETGPKAERAGEKAIRSLIHEVGLEEDQFEIKVVVDAIRHRGIMSCVKDHQLIISGCDIAREVRPLRQSLNETIALVVQRAPPLRLNTLAEWLPRINPTDHAELLHNLRQGSRWNADFISMLALAAAIATLGLMQNSPAVVIGSMLLAPMMTPMIGAGLALSQASVPLARLCARSMLYGFLLTLVVSLLLGIVIPSRETLPPEVLSRGSPNILDLLIALFAAIAATVAMARPGIAGAVAGVAIATALVPPICAIGISLSVQEFGNAFGAFLLFGTNMIAIVVASSFTFSLLGVVTGKVLKKNRLRVRWEKWGLVILLVLLAGPLSFFWSVQLKQGRDQTAVYPVTRAVADALKKHIEGTGINIVFLGRSSIDDAVVVQIASRNTVERHEANELRKIIRDTMEDQSLLVHVSCLDGQWMSSENEPFESDPTTPSQDGPSSQ